VRELLTRYLARISHKLSLCGEKRNWNRGNWTGWREKETSRVSCKVQDEKMD